MVTYTKDSSPKASDRVLERTMVMLKDTFIRASGTETKSMDMVNYLASSRVPTSVDSKRASTAATVS